MHSLPPRFPPLNALRRNGLTNVLETADMAGGQADAIAQRIENFIRRRFHVPADDEHFSREVNLWEEGYIDSIGVTEVILFVETTFYVKIPDNMLSAPEFTRISGMAGLIAGLLERRG